MNRSSAFESDDLVRAFSARSAPPPHDGVCPGADDIYEAAAGRLDEERRLAIVDHLAGCPDCACAWQLAAELQPASGSRTSSRRSLHPGWLAAAASVALVVGAGVLLVRLDESPVPGYREAAGTAGPETRLSQSHLPRDDFRLRWSAGPEGASYTVRVTDADLTPLFVRAGLEATEVRVPPESLAGAAAGEALLWQVDMRLPGGNVVASPTYQVELR